MIILVIEDGAASCHDFDNAYYQLIEQFKKMQ